MPDEITSSLRYLGTLEREITDQEKTFCEFILAGYRKRDAAFKAGFYDMKDRDDPDVQRKASTKARNLLQKKVIRAWLRKNAKTVIIHDDGNDRRALKAHIYDIAMGNVTMKVKNAMGDDVEVPPTFKDQVTAAALFYKVDNQDRQERLMGTLGGSAVVSAEITTKVTSFLSKYSHKTYHENGSVEMLKKNGIVDDADFEEVQETLEEGIDKEIEAQVEETLDERD